MKKLCFLLCLLLSLSTLFACSNKKDEDPDKDSTTTTAGTNEQKEGLQLSVSDMTTIGVGDTITITAFNAKTGVQTTAVQWTSDNSDIAFVDYQGNVKGIADGTAVITAKSIGGEFSASCTIKVTSVLSGITLNTQTLTIVKGETAELIASFVPESITDVELTWVSSDPSIASVKDGVVTAHKDGSTTIAVSAEGGVAEGMEGEADVFTAVCLVTVMTPAETVELSDEELVLVKGDTVQLTATVGPEDATDHSVEWTSSAPEIVSVSPNGELTALAGGDAVVITAKTSNGITATCTVSVSVPVTGVTITPNEVTLDPGTSQILELAVIPSDAADQGVLWESNNPSIVSVSASGEIKALKAGSATITVTTVQGYYTATCKVTVTNSITGLSFEQTEGSLLIGQTMELLPIKTPADAEDALYTWNSSDPDVASVDENGAITALVSGITTITVSTPNGVSATYTLNVIDPATISVPITGFEVENKRVNAGETFTLDVAVIPSNSTEKYLLNLPSTACVVLNSDGSLTALRKGNVIITVSNLDGTVTQECMVTVNEVDAATRAQMQKEYDAAKAALDKDHGEVLVAIGKQYDEDIEVFTDAVNNAAVKSEADYNSQKKALEDQLAAASEADKAKLQQSLDNLKAEWDAYQFAERSLKSSADSRQAEIDAENAAYQQKLTDLKNQYPYLFE